VSQLIIALFSGAIGAAASAVALRRGSRRPQRGESTEPHALTRLDAHRAAAAQARLTPANSTALRRDVQEVVQTREAAQDLEVLDRLLRDVRDLASADEAIFWRWVEARQTLVPNAWSSENQPRPRFFDMSAWGPVVRLSAEEGKVQFGGDIGGAPTIAVAPVLAAKAVYGVITVSSANGLQLDRDAARTWMARFAAQVAALMQLFDLRRDYGQHMRQSDALLDAVKRLHGHRTPEGLAQALCDTACEVTSAAIAGVVRWSSANDHGVLQAVSPAAEIEAGFHVTADSMVGRACVDRLPLVLEDAASAAADECPFGGQPRDIGSLAIVPILGIDGVIGAIVVEGRAPNDVSSHEARNVGLLAAVARGPLEGVWEMEEVSRRARTDALTGLANRRHFDEQLLRVVAETDRFGGTCSLILVDLDHFKAINDRRGHEAGDFVLKHVAQVLSDAIRTVDLCARYGGEEIAVLLPQTVESGAAELAERLRAALETRPVVYDGEQIQVTASFGVSTYPAPVPYGDWLVLAADKALYKAKAAGRNCVRVIQPNHVTPALYKSR
jgi:diguanylate cyclase (GGDEF)-like protein